MKYWIVAIFALAVVSMVAAELQVIAPIIVDSNVVANQTEPTLPTPALATTATPAPRKSKKSKSRFVYGDPKKKTGHDTDKKKTKKSGSDGSKNGSGGKWAKGSEGKKSKGSEVKKSKNSDDRHSKGFASPNALTKGLVGEAFAGIHGSRHHDFDDD